jgi:S-adenosylmethionine hydrolase
VELEHDGERFYAVAARTFGDAKRGDIVLYENSYRAIAVAINRGNAAETLDVRAGSPVTIHLDLL